MVAVILFHGKIIESTRIGRKEEFRGLEVFLWHAGSSPIKHESVYSWHG